MTDLAERPAAAATAPAAALGGKAGAALSALLQALVTFALAMGLLDIFVGLKADNAASGLEISQHHVKAGVIAAVIALARTLADVLVWRPLDGGATWRALKRIARRLRWPALAVALTAGAVFYFWDRSRTAAVEWVAAQLPAYSWAVHTAGDLIVFACASAFIVVALMVAARFLRFAAAIFSPNRLTRIPEALVTRFGAEFPAALLVIALALPLIVAGPQQRYAVDTATQILIYIMLGWGLNVVVGLAGLLDLGYVAFYAVGAYSYALISTHFGWPFWACLPLAGLFAAVWGITLGFPVLRLRGDYLAIVTLAFGEIIRIVLINWDSITGGPNGIKRIPRPSFFGLPFERTADPAFHTFFGIAFNPAHRVIFLYYLILALALITNFVTLRLRRLPIGRAWEAMREDEIAARSLGIDTVKTKLTAFAIGAMFGGFAGAFFSARQGFVSPESFTFVESALVLAIVVLGGLGSQLGVVIAAVVLVGASERFRELQDYRMLIFGLSMVAVMLWRPRGLMPGRTPSASLYGTRSISAALVKEGRG